MGQSLNGKVAVVTGAARGIGRAVAVALAKEGVNVGVIARSEDALQSVVKEMEGYGVKAAYAVADVTNLEQVQAAAAKLKEHLGLTDILINNAGTGKFEKLVDMDEALTKFAESKVYDALFDFDGTELWKEGPDYLLDLFEQVEGNR